MDATQQLFLFIFRDDDTLRVGCGVVAFFLLFFCFFAAEIDDDAFIFFLHLAQ
jgi:hypothetical protein